MNENNQSLIPVKKMSGWQTRTLLVGGIIGTILGVLSAYFYVRAAEEAHGGDSPEVPQATDAIKLGVSLLTIVRTITDWGRR